jgi:hypothetical protein
VNLRPGDEWGEPRHLPPDFAIAASDREAADLITEGPRLIGLSGGDLCRTLGGRGDVANRRGTQGIVCRVDVGTVDIDGTFHTFLAHVLVRGRFGLGPGAAIMNAEWVGALRLGPRSHPGDGLLDMTTGQLPPRQLLEARSRSRTGDHLPHRSLSVRRSASVEVSFDRPRLVFVDGSTVGRGCHIAASVGERTVDVVV